MIDFNADVGEGYNNEAQLATCISSFNISCGAHAGTVKEIEQTVKIAVENGITIGGHPSYPDKENFGRVELSLPNEELAVSLYQQLYFLQQLVEKNGGQLAYVKPHGALYHSVSKDRKKATLLLDVCEKLPLSNPKIMGPPNSVIHKLCIERNVGFIREAFADRRYQDDLTLCKRSMPASVLTTKKEVWEQVNSIADSKKVKSNRGNFHTLEVDSICFHSDTDNAVRLAKYCYQQLFND